MDWNSSIEEAKERGRAEARAEAEAEGRAKEAARVARNTLFYGASIELFHECTGLSISEIEALRE